MASLLLKIICIVLLLVLVLFLLRTWQLERGSDQKLFSKGTADVLPDGLYAGSVGTHQTSWLGKSFSSSTHSGINNFRQSDGTVRAAYPFLLSMGTGAHDSKEVIRIDYNLPANPWWLHPILDEIVLIGPGQYLGKLQLRLLPGYPFTLTYFRLTQNQ